MNPLTLYLIGFSLSLVLTLAAFGSVLGYQSGALPREAVIPELIFLAVLQLLAQVVCFLHLSEERAPRWRLIALLLALLMAGILMGGTMWIMENIGHAQEYREIFEGGEISPQAQHD